MTKKYVAGVFVQIFDKLKCLYITQYGTSLYSIDAICFATEKEAEYAAIEKENDFAIKGNARAFVEEV
jgi:hypothetical protein